MNRWCIWPELQPVCNAIVRLGPTTTGSPAAFQETLVSDTMYPEGFILCLSRINGIREINKVDTIARDPFEWCKSIPNLELNLRLAFSLLEHLVINLLNPKHQSLELGYADSWCFKTDNTPVIFVSKRNDRMLWLLDKDQAKDLDEKIDFLIKGSNSASNDDLSIAGILPHGRRDGNVITRLMKRAAIRNVKDQVNKFPLALDFNSTDYSQAVDLMKEVFIITPEKHTRDVRY